MAALNSVAENLMRRVREDERGDVPGWVMVTLMTAGIVVVLWAVAEEAIVGMFQRAMDSVVKGG
ncbi:hypothetical protein KRX56_06500 [Dermabacteraceae bacterium TAE3-ERU27]|nr:hypothetical protein [Dermabacteraceae bacterium TAE3-ERU27]